MTNKEQQTSTKKPKMERKQVGLVKTIQIQVGGQGTLKLKKVLTFLRQDFYKTEK